MERIDLEQLNKSQLNDLVQQQTGMIQDLTDTILPLTGTRQDIRGPRPNRHHKT